MNSPLVPKNSLGRGFFEVAVPRKPYYNPANLEKAGTRVKWKEFLQVINKSIGPPPAAHQRGVPPRGDFLIRITCLGSARPCFSAAHEKPLSFICRGRCASLAARCFSSSRPWTQSRCH